MYQGKLNHLVLEDADDCMYNANARLSLERRNFLRWKHMRSERKRELKDERTNEVKNRVEREEALKRQREFERAEAKKEQEDREFRLIQTSAVVARHQAVEQEASRPFDAMKTRQARGHHTPKLKFPRQCAQYNLYSSEFAAHPLSAPEVVDNSRVHIVYTHRPGRPKNRPVECHFTFLSKVYFFMCSLPKYAGAQSYTFDVQVPKPKAKGNIASETSDDDEDDDNNEDDDSSDISLDLESALDLEKAHEPLETKSVGIEVTFITDDYLKVKIPYHSLETEHFMRVHATQLRKSQMPLPSEKPNFVVFTGVNTKHRLEQARAKQSREAYDKRQALEKVKVKKAAPSPPAENMRSPSPKENWFNLNHPAGAYYGWDDVDF